MHRGKSKSSFIGNDSNKKLIITNITTQKDEFSSFGGGSPQQNNRNSLNKNVIEIVFIIEMMYYK